MKSISTTPQHQLVTTQLSTSLPNLHLSESPHAHTITHVNC